MEIEVLDQTDQKSEAVLLSAIKWWEERRLWFNIAVGLCGVLGIILFAPYLGMVDFINVFFYAVFVNAAYCAGFILEALNLHYLKGRFPLENYRMVLFVLGTLFSSAVTLLGAFFFYILMMPVGVVGF